MENFIITDPFGDKVRVFVNGKPLKTCIAVNAEGVAIQQHEAVRLMQAIAKMNGIELDIKIPISYRVLVHRVSPATALHYSLQAGQEITNGNLFANIVKYEKEL